MKNKIKSLIHSWETNHTHIEEVAISGSDQFGEKMTETVKVIRYDRLYGFFRKIFFRASYRTITESRYEKPTL